MNKLSSALLALCLAATGSLALAQTPKAMDSMEQNSMSKGSMDKGVMENGAMTRKKHSKNTRKPKQDSKMEQGGSMTMERTK